MYLELFLLPKTFGFSTSLISVFILFIWFFLSLIYQLNSSFTPFLSNLDHFSLLPRWVFFAPNPGKTDSHLIYRDIFEDNKVTQWKEIGTNSTRGFWSFIWHPHKRESKALFDAMSMLGGLSLQDKSPSKQRLLIVSLPYLFLLNAASRPKKEKGATRRQFAVIETQGFSSNRYPKIVMISEYHKLDDEN